MINTTFNMYKIKFDNLDKMNALKDYRNVRIYIDLEVVINRLLNSRINNFLIANGDSGDIKRMLVSNIINLAQHYRLYCAKHRVENQIYLFWNYPPEKNFTNKKYLPRYKASYILRMQGNTDNWMVVKNINEIYDSLLKIIKYVNQVYLLSSTVIESGVIPYIIAKDKNDDVKNIIVSSNNYHFQYTSKDFDIWVPNGDNSTILNSDNVLYHMRNDKNDVRRIKISDSFIPMILSIIGNKSRNIDKIPGIGFNGAVKLIEEGLNKYIITENTINVELLSKCIPSQYRDLFINNYHTIQITYQYQDILGSNERDIFNQIIDNYDDNALIYLNDRYFKDHLLMSIDTRSDQIYREEICKTQLKWVNK